ncbi:MAG: AAA family ATPase [Deltaproteobacteria bacterium]|nr:AAA family ATPase [Deltaproteobacteria bacterium]
MDEETLHQALLRKEAYPEATETIQFRETHASRLYLTDGHVYKIKKTVNFGFLDFSTLEKRRHFCQEEVRLNRRFSPDTYLGVVPLRQSGAGIRFDGPGETIEYAVVMKRLPEERMLDQLLISHPATLAREMERLARFIAAMHRAAPQPEHGGLPPDLETVAANWRENFQQTEPFAGQTIPAEGLAAARSRVSAFLEAEAPLLRRRQQQGFVRELHGDLHSEHVCLTDPIQIYDCIEFNRRFRISDILADLAFLLMDLESRNRRDLAALLLQSYRNQIECGAGAERLIPFYKAYRAWVRGKVASLAMVQHREGEEEFDRRRIRASHYLNLAMGYLAPPALILTCGLMGTGKSVFARELAAATGMAWLRSDAERKELAGIDPGAKVAVSYGSGLYSSAMSDRTYQSLLEKAERSLEKGASAVIDASFSKRRHREPFFQLGRKLGVPVLLAHLSCDRATLLERLRLREESGQDISDGRRELLDSQARAFEAAVGQGVIEIDSGAELDYNVGRTLSRLLAEP